MQEMIVIFLIVLLLFGAKKIPELARGVGKGMGEFKKAKTEFEREIKEGEEEGKRDWDESTKAPAPAAAKKETAPAADTSEEASADSSDESKD